MVEFSAPGAPNTNADAIETLARAQGHVTALVVPWESSAAVLSMAVTSVKIDGWAIEHTNLGTITLTADGGGTRVAFVGRTGAGDRDDQAAEKLARVFDAFARDVRQRLSPATDNTR